MSGDDETYALLEEQFLGSFEASNQSINAQVRKGEEANAMFEKVALFSFLPWVFDYLIFF